MAKPRLPRHDGVSLHEHIPASRWCVTKEDLKIFRASVRSAIRCHHVRPTDQDKFHPLDDKYGPCIHTVVAQFIKPICMMAGNVSWALARHPEGLECDLFITHGWEEGIFEFIDKVLHSWPLNVKSAYCCMLSNPQTLDISSIIASPMCSPFAKALASSKIVLVIGNQHGSIYDRCWCTYEAFLACTWGKILIVGCSPLPWLCARCSMIVFSGAASAVGFCLVRKMTGFDHVTTKNTSGFENGFQFEQILMLLAEPVLCVALLSKPGMVRTCFNHMSVASQTWWLMWIILAFNAKLEKHGFIFALAGLALQTFHCLACVISESDQLWERQLKLEADQLKRGYSGRIADARASVRNDKEAILTEIRQEGKEELVNATIQNLLQCGTSTEGLRKAAALGINISGAGATPLRGIMLVLAAWVECFRFYAFQVQNDGNLWLLHTAILITLGVCLAMVSTCFVSELHKRDKISYMCTVSWKFVCLPYLFARLIYFALRLLSRPFNYLAMSHILIGSLSLMILYSAILCTFFDVARLALLPVVGLPLARHCVSFSIWPDTETCSQPSTFRARNMDPVIEIELVDSFSAHRAQPLQRSFTKIEFSEASSEFICL